MEVWSNVRLRFRKSMSGHHFQTIRKLANPDYHRGVIYTIYQYILTTKCVFSSWKEFYIDLWSFWLPNYCPFWPYLYTRFCPFFKCLINFRAYALQCKHNKVGYTNFVKFRLQSIRSKIERAFEKRKKKCFLSSFCSNFNVIFSALFQ